MRPKCENLENEAQRLLALTVTTMFLGLKQNAYSALRQDCSSSCNYVVMLFFIKHLSLLPFSPRCFLLRLKEEVLSWLKYVRSGRQQTPPENIHSYLIFSIRTAVQLSADGPLKCNFYLGGTQHKFTLCCINIKLFERKVCLAKRLQMHFSWFTV